MSKIESVNDDIFKKFENEEAIEISGCKGKGSYSTGKGYVHDRLCRDTLVTYPGGHDIKYDKL